MNQYDFVIIGGGLGGLTCASILSRKGYSVCVLEKNPVIGGCLQSYQRNGGTYETGVHYLGSLDKGQILHKLFSYIGILPLVKFEKLNEDAFDIFTFGDNPEVFGVPQGYEEYVRVLSERFPFEKEGIRGYCQRIREVSHRFPLYTFKGTHFDEKADLFYANAYETICSCVTDPILRCILAGNNPLYAGVAEKTPLYVHALIVNSFIESSWRCSHGGSSIAEALVKVIRDNGGTIVTRAEVASLDEDHYSLTRAVTTQGESYWGKRFISSLHPAVTLSLTRSTLFRPVYRKRIIHLENTISPFLVNIRFKRNSFPFLNCNHYHYDSEDVWGTGNYTEEDWPKGFVLFTSTQHEGKGMAKTGCIMAYMRFGEVTRWSHTHNTVSTPGVRGEDYEQFKLERANRLIELASSRYPALKDAIEDFHVATPLTFRDYFGNPEGSLYGVQKDSHEPMKSYFPTRTKIPNLFLTGQSMSVHGVLGVAMSAIITCGEFLGLDEILNEVKRS